MNVYRRKLRNFYEILSLNMKRTLSAGYYVVLAVGVGIFVVVCLINYFNDSDDRMTSNGIWILITMFPSAVAVFLGMSTIIQEGESRTLEVLFASSTSRYAIWFSRMGTVYLATGGVVVLLSVLSFIFIADFPFLLYIFNALFPLLWFTNLALLLSLLFKSANAAGMVMLILGVPLYMFYEGFKSLRFYPLLNPFDPPRGMADPTLWMRICVENRLLLLFFAALFLALSLVLLNRRERLL